MEVLPPTAIKLFVSALRRDGGCQPRARTDDALAADYGAAMLEGAVFPPVVAFFDGREHWLADGYHRVQGAEGAGITEILADVRQGTRRDAVLYSVGANASHGMRRTNADKRRAVETLLTDPEWAGWSDREIARRCAVDHKTVAAMRPPPPEPEPVSGELPQMDGLRTVQRGSTVYEQRTNTINAGRPSRAERESVAREAGETAMADYAERKANAGTTPSLEEGFKEAGEAMATALERIDPPRQTEPARDPKGKPPQDPDLDERWIEWIAPVKHLASEPTNLAGWARACHRLPRAADYLVEARNAEANLRRWIETLETTYAA